MTSETVLSIKRSITIRAVVTPSWKEEAERELSNAISTTDQQMAQLEKEGQQVVDDLRSQSANPLDPRVQDQVLQVQQQVAAKRAELEGKYCVCPLTLGTLTVSDKTGQNLIGFARYAEHPPIYRNKIPESFIFFNKL